MGNTFEQKYKNNIRIITGLGNLPYQDDSVLLCDTTTAPVAITLLAVPQNYWSTQYKLYIRDSGNPTLGTGNAAVNNITITAPVGYTISGATSVVININNGGVLLQISSNSSYSASGFNLIGTSGMVTANTVYVMKNGNDATGVVERFDKPFLTIAAARAAAIAAYTPTVTNRILIKVFSGNYAETIVLANFIDYDLSDCVITQTTQAVSITDNNIAVDSIIYGKANLRSVSDIDGTRIGIAITNVSSKVCIYMNDIYMYSPSSDHLLGMQLAGKVNLYVNDIYIENGINRTAIGIQVFGGGVLSAKINNLTSKGVGGIPFGVYVTGVGSSIAMTANSLRAEGGLTASLGATTVAIQDGGVLQLTCDNIFCVSTAASAAGGACIQQAFGGGAGVIKCNTIVCQPTLDQNAVCISFGAAGTLILTNQASLTVDCVSATTVAVSVTNSVIKQENADVNARFFFKGRAVMLGGINAPVISKNTGIMILDDVTLVGDAATINSITCPVPNNVYIYGGRTNKPVDANTTELVGALVVDANVI